ncbi:MAG: PLP-dependent aspartate aminotransferase family protein [Pseudomonadota bacterium]
MANRPDLKTLSVHAGEELDEEFGAIAPPLILASSFAVHPDAVGFSAYDYEDQAPYFYSRWSNPTVRRLERKLAALEGAGDGVCFASGMAAISGLLLHKLSAGDHLVLSNACYAAVAELAHDTLPRMGIEASAVDTSDLAAVEAALRPTTKLIYIETPCNPILRLADVQAIAALAKARGAELAVDSTIATPLGLQPIALGADYVVHSLTKYLCGHGDALGGVVLGAADKIDGLRKESLVHLGGLLGAFDAWLILRSLHSLPARMAAHQAGAAEVAAYLEAHPRIERVLYPGLASHPQHTLAKSQMSNASGLLAFTARDGAALARRLAERLEVFTYAVSLGKSKSLIFYIPTDDIQRTSFRLSEADLAAYRAWAGEGVFRVSVGLERAEDLIADLEKALAD